jgi:hypothetical protein
LRDLDREKGFLRTFSLKPFYLTNYSGLLYAVEGTPWAIALENLEIWKNPLLQEP